jgi:hypothetical protein
VTFGCPLLQVSSTMPRHFRTVKLREPVKAVRMRDDDPPLCQQQVANSEHGHEAVCDHAIEHYPAEEGEGAAAGADSQASDTDDMFRPIDLQFNDDSWLFAAMGQGEEPEAVRVLEFTEGGQCTLMMPRYCATRRQFGCEAKRTSAGQHTATLNLFALLKLRPITFSDGIVLCCVCSNPGCNRSTEIASLFAWHHPQKHHQTCAEACGGSSALCCCAQVALSANLGAKGDELQTLNLDGREGDPVWSCYQEQDEWRAQYYLYVSAPGLKPGQ